MNLSAILMLFLLVTHSQKKAEALFSSDFDQISITSLIEVEMNNELLTKMTRITRLKDKS